MKRKTVERFVAARRLAQALGATLEDCGCPRGERRVYSLRTADGKLLETTDIGRIERKLQALTPNPNSARG